MHLSLENKLSDKYSSSSQKVRVLTELWVDTYGYCPNCGDTLSKYPNNRPVADFFCSNCQEDYELKSKSGSMGAKIVDGAYHSMINRLNGNNSPSFFFLSYNKLSNSVTDFLVIPKHFFVPDIIEKRKPLAASAKRAGWVGCNLLLSKIPNKGKIYIIRNQYYQPQEKVLAAWKNTLFLNESKSSSAKGWLLDIMLSIDAIGQKEFSLSDIYAFENRLRDKYPKNSHIKEKIRQQLQALRENGYLEFKSRGQYRVLP